MKKLTIKEAIFKVLNNSKVPLSSKSIYDSIIEHDYYRFKAENPPYIVRSLIRRHCQGLDFPSSSTKKYYQIFEDGTYQTIDFNPTKGLNATLINVSKSNILKELKDLHSSLTLEFKQTILSQLKSIDPEKFEIFCKKLLEVYGFKDLMVTQVRKDGGIDGYGKLKVGITYLNVAFQSKRWKDTSVGRTEIDKFRGAIQGDFEQGIFITTSTFSKQASNATTKKGAVPIILIDGSMVVDIMIEKRFGISVEHMPIYINSIDEISFE
jgi:restriction system protein